MVDLHTHILPNIDDGAQSVEESLLLIQSLLNQSISKVVCTPHFNPTQLSLEDFVKRRDQSMSLLKEANITLIPGSETILHEYLFHYPDLNGLCIGNTRYLLTELPYCKWNDKTYELLERFISYYNICPLIAHIERYTSVKKSSKSIKRLIDLGCVIQVNSSSITEENNLGLIVRYMKQGFIDVIASDCHNMTVRPPTLDQAFSIIGRKFGLEYCELLKRNAQSIVDGVMLREKENYII